MTDLEINRIYNMDCVKGMEMLDNECVNCIVADPPFGILFSEKQTYNRNHSLVIGKYEDILKENYYKFTLKWMKQAKRILEDSGTIAIFSGYNNMIDILNSGKKLGLTLFNQVIWNFAFGVNTSKRFVTSHYNILMYSKNEKKRNFYTYSRFKKNDKSENGGNARYADMESVWRINKEYWTGCQKIPTKLPLEVCKKIIAYTTKEDNLIVDAFCGTGQACWAAKEMNRNYIGFEIEKENYEFATKRLNENKYLIK